MLRRRRPKSCPLQRAEFLEVRTLPATFVVTSLADTVEDDDGQTTLREAFQSAEADSAHDDIVFAEGLSGVITLTGGRFEWYTPITITGNSRDDTIIDANNASDIFYSEGYVQAGGHLTLRSMTLRNAKENAVGLGASDYAADITVEDALITGSGRAAVAVSLSSYDGEGGRARLSIRNSTITGNGGGVSVFSGVNAIIEDTTISNNSGGGIYSGGYSEGWGRPSTTVSRSVVSGNTATKGAGINSRDGDLVVIESLITGNTASRDGGGIYSYAGLVADRTTVSDNSAGGQGGGIASSYGTVTNSTISGNRAHQGGGFHGTRTDIRNSTITGNHATDSGGGVFGGGGGIESSIVAGNTADTSAPDFDATSTVTLKHSLLGDNSGTDFDATGDANPDADGNLIGEPANPIDPKLGDLQDVGIIAVHPLASDSPAIGRGSNPLELEIDQAGGPRLRGEAVDIGAVEEGLRPFLTATSFQASEGADGTAELRFEFTLNLGSAEPFTVDVSTVDGSATVADNDYTTLIETISFDGVEGETQTVVVQVNGDRYIEGDESLLLRVDSISNPDVAPPLTDTLGTIVGDDTEGMEFELADRVLSITTFDTDDTMDFVLEDGRIRIDINGSLIDYGPDELDSITIRSNGGADVITGRLLATPMWVDAGSGSDTVKGGLGNDTLFGSIGNDRLRGTQGDDLIDGGDGDDSILGQVGDDTLFGQDGVDTLNGGDGDDSIEGGPGADSLVGEDGNDSIVGGVGDDSAVGGKGDDSILGGFGADTLSGGEGNDSLDGGEDADILFGEVGDDTLTGSRFEYEDTLVGAGGNDSLSYARVMRGGGGDDLLSFGQRIGAGSGNDTLIGTHLDDYLNGGPGADVLSGEAGDDTLLGRGGNDILLGGNGEDFLQGLTGRDILLGGIGLDSVYGNGGEDIVIGGRMKNSVKRIQHMLDLQSEWLSDRSYDQRVANIRNDDGASDDRLNTTFLIGRDREGENVFFDQDIDDVRGGNQNDFFFAKSGRDLLDDKLDAELLEEIKRT